MGKNEFSVPWDSQASLHPPTRSLPPVGSLPDELNFVLVGLQRISRGPLPLVYTDNQARTAVAEVAAMKTRFVFWSRSSLIGLAEYAADTPGWSTAIVLADWHQGRLLRSPSRSGLSIYYWYQWPSLYLRASTLSAEIGQVSSPAILLSDSPAFRNIFSELAAESGFAGWAAHLCSPLPTIQPRFVLIDTYGADGAASRTDDCLDRSVGTSDTLMKSVRQVRIAYPTAAIVVLDDFPRWSIAAATMQAGADGVCGKPTAMRSLLSFLNRPDITTLLGRASA